MRRPLVGTLLTSVAICASVIAVPPTAHAEDVATYEIVSADIGLVDIEYRDLNGVKLLQDVALPWRTDVTLRAPDGPPPHGGELRADWRPNARPSKWVTVRIFYRGEVLCQNTLDIGNATCYGVTPHFS